VERNFKASEIHFVHSFDSIQFHFADESIIWAVNIGKADGGFFMEQLSKTFNNPSRISIFGKLHQVNWERQMGGPLRKDDPLYFDSALCLLLNYGVHATCNGPLSVEQLSKINVAW
jgi:hypothetical protein